jgi:hypothetical protein
MESLLHCNNLYRFYDLYKIMTLKLAQGSLEIVPVHYLL